jgi:hypothetical protein
MRLWSLTCCGAVCLQRQRTAIPSRCRDVIWKNAKNPSNIANIAAHNEEPDRRKSIPADRRHANDPDAAPKVDSAACVAG